MSVLDIFILALALAVDAGIVSFSYGLIIKKQRLKNSMQLAFATGFGQFIMPVLGWLGTKSVSAYLAHFDHWISFLVFLLLGLNIINEALHEKDDEIKDKHLSFTALFVIGVATSIDACAAGVTLFFINVSIVWASTIIGLTTFIVSCLSFYLCRSLQKISTQKIEIFAGLILIFLGFKILFEHLTVL